jgi:hypothetical protein
MPGPRAPGPDSGPTSIGDDDFHDHIVNNIEHDHADTDR